MRRSRSASVPGPIRGLLVLSACLVLPGTVSGQVIRGLVLDGDGSPVEGMFMVAFELETGARSGAALSGPAGAFTIPVGGAGTFRVRGERIGLTTVFSPPLRVDSASIPFVELTTGPEAVVLEGLEVKGEERCRVDPEVGSATARVWDEVRKALEVAEWTAETGAHRYRFRRFVRDLDADGRMVHAASERYTSGWSKNPYVSAPPERLATSGFTSGRAGDRDFYGPDAHVLLSDEFLQGHCFRLKREEDRGGPRVGLEFRPVKRTGNVDIEGVLWLRSGLLDRVEFRYVDFDPDVRSALIGGTVEFQRLDSGHWIVPKWVLRLPSLGVRTGAGAGSREHFLAGIREEGGEVTWVVDSDRTASAHDLGERGAIRGMVFDSTSGSALAGARVYASGTAHQAFTDGEGAFEISGVPAGDYVLGVMDERLDSLGMRVEPRAVRVHAETTSQVELAVPSVRSWIADALCPATARSDSTAILVGFVRDRNTGVSVAGATVRITVSEMNIRSLLGGLKVTKDHHWIETRTGPDGRYAFCDVHTGQLLQVEARHKERAGDPASVHVRLPGVVMRQDLGLPTGEQPPRPPVEGPPSG